MNARPNRREVTKWMLSTALGGLTAARLNAGAAIFPSSAHTADFESVRSRIQEAMGGGNATGVAVALVHGGRIVWEEGFGWANREAGLKATPHTPFSMASITKPFTTTAIMTLV